MRELRDRMNTYRNVRFGRIGGVDSRSEQQTKNDRRYVSETSADESSCVGRKSKPCPPYWLIVEHGRGRLNDSHDVNLVGFERVIADDLSLARITVTSASGAIL